MNKKWLPWAIAGGIALLIVMMFAGTYNSLVAEREKVEKAFSDVKVQYQRRADLVDNLVATVKGSSDFEKSTLTAVTDARSQVGKVTIDASASSAQVQQYVEAQNQMTGALSRLIAVAENYPDIKSTAAYQDLLSQLEGTENRIAVARTDYNEAARSYNTRVQTFPTNLIAGIFGFTSRPYFEATAGSETVPTVNFGN